MFDAGPLGVNLTSYCPYKAGLTAKQQQMEGGKTDVRGNALITLESHLSDPATYPYVSCAGDLTEWSYGQAVELPSISTVAIFRVVDTGAAFHGPPWYADGSEPEPKVTSSAPRKKFRAQNADGSWREPIDVCVDDCSNHPGGFGAQDGNVPGDGVVQTVKNIIGDPGASTAIVLVGVVAVVGGLGLAAWLAFGGTAHASP